MDFDTVMSIDHPDNPVKQKRLASTTRVKCRQKDHYKKKLSYFSWYKFTTGSKLHKYEHTVLPQW